VNYYFVGLLIACTVYACIAGGAPERIGAIAYALSCAATYFVISAQRGAWQNIEYGVFFIDIVTLVFFCLLALRANRFWPVWASAFLGLGVLGHLGRWVMPDAYWWAYAVVLTIWSYPILATIALGTWAYKRRLAQSGAEQCWSSVRSDLSPSRWYTKYRTLPRRQNRRQLRSD
jgi:hypothetical protein